MSLVYPREEPNHDGQCEVIVALLREVHPPGQCGEVPSYL